MISYETLRKYGLDKHMVHVPEWCPKCRADEIKEARGDSE
jgi:hypothetical protein